HPPSPMGMGEHGLNLGALLNPNAFGHVVLSAGGPDNVQRANDAFNKLVEFQNTNWEIFKKIFSKMMSCVPTYLVPGNHDYNSLGYEFTGMSPREFKDLTNAIGNDIAERESGELLDFLMPLTFGIVSRQAIIDYFINQERPDYNSMENYKDTGLNKAEILKYDQGPDATFDPDDNVLNGNPTYYRKLESNWRALLGGIWAERGVSGIYSVGGIPQRNEHFTIPKEEGSFRLAFIDQGPQWNKIKNIGWMRGFPSHEKEPNPMLEKIIEWRNEEIYKDDFLIFFMHGPPLSIGPISDSKTDEIVSRCFKFIWGPEAEDYRDPCPSSYIWNKPNRIYPGDSTGLEVNNDPNLDAPYHNNREFLMNISPLTNWGTHNHTTGSTNLSEEKIRNQPIIIFAGHSHRRHTYSLKQTIRSDDETYMGCTHFRSGLKQLKNLNDSLYPKDWWEAEKSLILEVGCLGPIPPSDITEDMTDYLAVSHPEESQGFYLVTLKDDVVTKIEWNSLWYNP
ncbi:unnamed protein product, partial [marine sediment metagenome]